MIEKAHLAHWYYPREQQERAVVAWHTLEYEYVDEDHYHELADSMLLWWFTCTRSYDRLGNWVALSVTSPMQGKEERIIGFSEWITYEPYSQTIHIRSDYEMKQLYKVEDAEPLDH